MERNNCYAKQSPTSDSSVEALKAIYQTERRNILHRIVAGIAWSQSALNLFKNETAISQSGYGYQIKIPTAETCIVCHLTCMDDIKVYARTPTQLNELIKIVELLTEDIRLDFCLDKCRMLNIRHGKVELEGSQNTSWDNRANDWNWYIILAYYSLETNWPHCDQETTDNWTEQQNAGNIGN